MGRTACTEPQCLYNGALSSSFSSSSLGPVSLCPGCTSALCLLCNPKYSNQYKFNNPVPLIKRHRSLTEAVLISFGSTSGFPETSLTLIPLMWRIWWAPNNASKWQMGINSPIKGLRVPFSFTFYYWNQLGGQFLSTKALCVKVHNK